MGWVPTLVLFYVAEGIAPVLSLSVDNLQTTFRESRGPHGCRCLEVPCFSAFSGEAHGHPGSGHLRQGGWEPFASRPSSGHVSKGGLSGRTLYVLSVITPVIQTSF